MPSLTSNLYEFGEFRLDTQKRVLRKGVEAVALTSKALDVLLLLIQHSGEVVSKDELMKGVWSDSFVEESNLTQTVFMLRKALGESSEQRYIVTVQGRGYRFVADVKQSAANASVKSASAAAESASVVEHPEPNSWSADSSQTLLRPPAPLVRRLAVASGWNWLLATGSVLLVLIAASLAYLRLSKSQKPAADPQRRVLLAVLPFQNLTGDPAQEYFSDGLTEEMITQLGNLDPQHLEVVARTSVMHYKNSQTSLDQIGRELGVQYVLEGSVRRDSNQVRVTAQLIQTKDQSHVWARKYDREPKGLLALQSEIAEEIANEIQLTLGDHKSNAAQPPLSSQEYEAYDLYLKGQYFFNKRTAASLQAAIGYFQQATIKNPNYARAYAGMADAYTLMGAYSGHPLTEFMPKARAAALRALEIDDRLPEAHAALALIVQNYDWDWQTAEKEFRRAIELNPNYATAHHWYAEHLMWRGRFDEALQESERARQLDPLSLIIAADNGAILYFSRQYDRAIEKWQSVLEMDPDFSRAHLIRGAYLEKGMFAEALADTEKERNMTPVPGYWSWLAIIYGRSGQSPQARHALQELLQSSRSHPVDAMFVAWAYLGMGDKDHAFVWFEKAYAQHSNELASLRVSPACDPLRSDPRFQDLLHRVGLAN
jgi:TolB-like protein/DNA-binding winged helix-turn-helix (wHTH) protein/Tfp pilus assembly protein PilF